MDFFKSTKGEPFGSAGGRTPEGGGASAPPPKSASEPIYLYFKVNAHLFNNLFVIVQDSVHVFDPGRIDWTIEHNPLPPFVILDGLRMLSEYISQHSVTPLV